MGIGDVFDEHLEVAAAAREALPRALEQVVDALAECVLGGGKILACGNGGSAADSQHMVAELVGRLGEDRPAIPAVALTTDGATISAVANDLGFDQVFVRQIAALARPGDVVITLSTSGRSANVIAAAEHARALGCVVVCFTGRGGGRLAELGHHTVVVPSSSVQRIQEMHVVCIHAIVEALEKRLAAAR